MLQMQTDRRAGPSMCINATILSNHQMRPYISMKRKMIGEPIHNIINCARWISRTENRSQMQANSMQQTLLFISNE